MSISENIQARMQAKGLNIQTLTILCELPYQTVWNIVRGKRQPKIQTLQKIAKALDCTVGGLVR